MKRIKKVKFKQEEINEASKKFSKIGQKQVMGVSRVEHSNHPPFNIYTMEDGTQIIEDDKGKALKSIPQPPKIEKKDNE